MAQPKCAMKKLLKREDYFIKGASEKEAGMTLASRFPGFSDEWERMVKRAVKDGTLIRTIRDEGWGYRTLTGKERTQPMEAASIPMLADKVVAVA